MQTDPFLEERVDLDYDGVNSPGELERATLASTQTGTVVRTVCGFARACGECVNKAAKFIRSG